MYGELHLNRLNIFKLFIIFTKWHSSQKIKTMIKNWIKYYNNFYQRIERGYNKAHANILTNIWQLNIIPWILLFLILQTNEINNKIIFFGYYAYVFPYCVFISVITHVIKIYTHIYIHKYLRYSLRLWVF